MEVIAFAKEFRDGIWSVWEHICDDEELEGVQDSARAKAGDRIPFGTPSPADYLAGVRYIFDVMRGTEESPREGDRKVYGVCVNGILIGVYGELRGHFKIAQEAA
jgi:hypothetical protein